jgi:fatty-acyl-CoA synthase
MSIYDQHLDKNAANFVALSPVSFVERSAEVFGDLPAVIHGARRYSWAQTRERSARLAAALRSLGVGRGVTVSVLLPNTPEMVEVHYAVPALNAVLNTLNTRLEAALLAWQMNHCEAQVLIADREFAPLVAQALRLLRQQLGREPMVIDVADSEYAGSGERLGSFEYEAMLAAHAPLERLEGGWFHTGDLAVREADRYVKIRDRSKDVIISGGENISSIEVEDALYRHPAVLACAVVARSSSAIE